LSQTAYISVQTAFAQKTNVNSLLQIVAAENDEQRKQNIEYALIAIGIIILLTLYLLLSRSFITNTKLIEFFGVITFPIVFGFLNLFLHPQGRIKRTRLSPNMAKHRFKPLLAYQ
jgi:uncharacterized integral membrane protein